MTVSDRPLRVLYVQLPTGGGSAESLFEAIRRLDRDRVEPIVLLPPGAPLEARLREIDVRVRAEAVPGWSVPGRKLSVPGPLGVLSKEVPVARRIARIIRQERVDLMHHNQNPSASRGALLAGRITGVPQVCHVRFFARYNPPVDRRLARYVDCFVFISKAVQRHCQAALGDDRPSLVLDNPFTLHPREPEQGRAALAALGVPADVPVVTVVGRLVRWKGQHVLLRALAGLSGGFPDLRCLIVGEAGSDDASRAYARELVRQAEALGLADRVHFTGHRTDVSRLMSASSVAVHTASEPEPFGRVVVEAMAVGTPVIATAAGGVPEIIDHGRTGLLVRPGDDAGLARAIAGVLANPERAGAMAAEGLREARERFGSATSIRTLERTYDRLHTGLGAVA